jgi:hypothetical protein
LRLEPTTGEAENYEVLLPLAQLCFLVETTEAIGPDDIAATMADRKRWN